MMGRNGEGELMWTSNGIDAQFMYLTLILGIRGFGTVVVVATLVVAKQGCYNV